MRVSQGNANAPVGIAGLCGGSNCRDQAVRGGGRRKGRAWSRPALLHVVAAVVAGVSLSSAAVAGEADRAGGDKQALIEEALSAAPPQVADTATVIDLEGNVLRKGSGEYTCLPAPPGFGGPLCHDEQFMARMQAFMNG
jgi:hypothetical protein